MPVETKLYCVLIASPGDVKAEREIIREEIHRWNSMHALDMKMVLQPVGWETDATPDLQERGQAVIGVQVSLEQKTGIRSITLMLQKILCAETLDFSFSDYLVI
jgi:hypothetical protein